MSNRLETYRTLENTNLRKSKGNQNAKVNDLLKLYNDENLFSKITIQRELNRYLGRFKSEVERDLYFFQTMAKHLGMQPSTDKRRDKRMKERSKQLDQLLKKAKERQPKARYTVKAILYSRAGYEGQKKWKHDGVTYYQVTVRSYDVIAPKPFPDEVYRKHIIDYEGNDLWDTAFKIMITNKGFKELFERGYIEVIYIMDYDIIPTSGKKV